MSLPTVAVVIPTIPGREMLLAQTEAAYSASRGVEVRLYVVNGAQTIGEGWQAGREAVAAATLLPDFVHLSADDVEPTPYALQAACNRADAGMGVYPSPRITNPDGTLHSCGTLGAGMLMPEVHDGHPAGSSPFPLLHTARLAQIPPIPPIHYYADDWMAVRARRLGLTVEVCRAFELRHLEGAVGIERMRRRAMADRAAMLQSLAMRMVPDA